MCFYDLTVWSCTLSDALGRFFYHFFYCLTCHILRSLDPDRHVLTPVLSSIFVSFVGYSKHQTVRGLIVVACMMRETAFSRIGRNVPNKDREIQWFVWSVIVKIITLLKSRKTLKKC